VKDYDPKRIEPGPPLSVEEVVRLSVLQATFRELVGRRRKEEEEGEADE